jgi:hypothetical protein
MSTEQALQAQAIHEPELLKKANVVGVAVGFKEEKGETQGELSVVVLVEQKKPLAALSAQDVIPPEVDGMKTDVYEVGLLRAQQFQSPRDRFRPVIPAGVSIGHFKVTAGTFGFLVTDRTTGEKFVLSNNHVLANSNDAQIGDAILQPGAIDGGLNPSDIVATLERFVRLRYTDEPPVAPPTPPGPGPGPTPPVNPGGCLMTIVAVINAFASLFGTQQRVATLTPTSSGAATSIAIPTPVPLSAVTQAVPENRVDCALGRPVDPAMFSDQIRQIGAVSGTKPATLGMRVRKYGRTTEYTEGLVTLMNATVNIAYNTVAGSKTARFTGQVITEAMSQGGDSGSLVLDTAENKAVGLLYAGSELATIFSPIDEVLNALNVNI